MAKKEQVKEMDIFEEFADLTEEKYFPEPKWCEPANVKYEGLPVKIAGKEYIIPSLSTGQYKRLAEKLSGFSEWSQSKQIDFSVFLSFLAISRNYEGVKKEWLEENLPPSTIAKFVNYIMSGMTQEEINKIESEKKS